MNKIKDRVILIADYIINTKATIRVAAKKFNVSKSTVHKDIKEKLVKMDYNKYLEIVDIFKNHIETRHILGGESTKRKYEHLKLINER